MNKNKSFIKNKLKNKSLQAFTIVELLIVIVIIGILAAITIVSYTGIVGRATGISLQADLDAAKTQFELYKLDHGQYPTGLDGSNCALGNIAPSPDTKYCPKPSNGATFTLTGGGTSDYNLKLNKGDIAYVVTNSTPPTLVVAVAVAASFVKAWGGTGSDVGNSLINTSDGGYAVTGQTNSYGAGDWDMFLAKYDASGNLSWNKTWGGAGVDYGKSIVQTSDGGYAVTGHTVSYGADMFLVKYDASGNLSWSKTWGGASTDYGQSLVQTSDGGYAITGYTVSYGAGGADVFLAKYDASGNLSWNKTWGGTSADYGCSLVQTSDGGYAITGQTTSYGAGSYDMFLVKYDSSGNFSWNKIWGGTNIDSGQSLVQTSDGGYATSGYTSNFGTGNYYTFLVKYDSSGNLSWNKLWGGSTGDALGRGLTKTSDGGYAITGNASVYGAGNWDMFLTKYDASGNFSWSKTWGGTSNDYGYGLTKTSDGGYAVIGSTASYGAGGDDMLFTKYNSSGGINSCSSPMCQIPTATVTSPTASVSSPSATVTSPSATVTSPSATVTSPSPTSTTIVAAP